MDLTAENAKLQELYRQFLQFAQQKTLILLEKQFQIRNAVEVVLVGVIIALLVQRVGKPKQKKRKQLSDKEKDELIEQFIQERKPLVPELTKSEKNVNHFVLSSHCGPYVTFTEEPKKKILNTASYNFLSLQPNTLVDHTKSTKTFPNEPKHSPYGGPPEPPASGAISVTQGTIQQICQETIEKFGVGACGPRGFYGTTDLHLHLEHQIARFVGSDEAIVYSYDLATLPSTLPAFANKQDVVILDEGCHFAGHSAANLSRANCIQFKHNDMADLEAKLKRVCAEYGKPRPLNRRFIVVEAVYQHTGDIAPLREIVRLKNKYKFRLMLDESLAIGVLGPTGRGLAEATGVTMGTDVDIITASLSNSIASIGGFTAGSSEVVDHQRISGAGYCFSASNPAVLVNAAASAINYIDSQAGLDALGALQRITRYLRERLLRTRGVLVLDPRVVGGEGQGGVGESPVVMFWVYDSRRVGVQEAFAEQVRPCVLDGGKVGGVGRVVGWLEDELMAWVAREVEQGDREEYLCKLLSVQRWLVKAQGVLVGVNRRSRITEAKRKWYPCLRVSVMSQHTQSDVDALIKAIEVATGKWGSWSGK